MPNKRAEVKVPKKPIPGFAEAFASPPPKRSGECIVEVYSLEHPNGATIRDLVEDPDQRWSARALAMMFKERGINVSSTTIRDHRADPQRCACSPIGANH